MMKSVSTASALTSFSGMAVFALTSILVFASIVGISHTAGMQFNERGEMEGCVFTGKVMLCKMNSVEHISLWQSMRTATLQKTSILVLFLVLVFAIGLLISGKYLLHFLHRQENDVFFDPVRYGLAHGILNPKIYEPARL